MTDEWVHLNFEKRITRLEYLAYLIAVLSAANFAGVRVFDAISLFPHP